MKKLSVGILLNSFSISSWAYSALEKAIKNDDIQITGLIVRREEPSSESSILKKLFKPAHIFLAIFYRLDKFITGLVPVNIPDPRKNRSILSLAPNAKIIEVVPQTGEFSDWILPDDIRDIQSLSLDVLFRGGFRILRGDILTKCARYGVWSFHHGNNRDLRGQPSGFWEFTEKRDTIGAILQVLSENLDGGQVLHKVFCPVKNALTWSILLNRLYWKASEALPKCFHIVAEQENEGFQRLVSENKNAFDIYDRRLYIHPNIVASLKAICILFRNLVHRIFRRIFQVSRASSVSEWDILYSFSTDTSAPTISLSMRNFKRLSSPKGHFWADPFVRAHNDKNYLFFEDYSFEENKGSIAMAELTKNGLAHPPNSIIVEDYHMSYPFVFEYNGNTYMIPETKAAEQIRLYKSVEFPLRWEFQNVMIDNILASDSTVFEHNGRWWMFTLVSSVYSGGGETGLHLFYSDSPLGGWTPHPYNPVNMDANSERPAGNIFKKDGKLFRFGQIGKEYGWGIAVCEIDILTEYYYHERVIEVIEPRWDLGIYGTHTLNIYPEIVVADCKTSPF